MKKIALSLIILFVAGITHAQTKTASVAPAATKVNITLLPDSFESTLAAGKINLLKTFAVIQEGSAAKLSYSLTGSAGFRYNGGKPMDVRISRAFYDGQFLQSSADISSKSAILLKYIQDKNINLDDEKGWISLISYYNAL